MGFASAMAWLLFAISMVVTLINIGVSRRFVYYQGDAADERRRRSRTLRRRSPAGAAAPLPDGRRRRSGAGTGRGPTRAGSRRRCFVLLLIGLAILFLYPFEWLISGGVQAARRDVRQRVPPAALGVELHRRGPAEPRARRSSSTSRRSRAGCGTASGSAASARSLVDVRERARRVRVRLLPLPAAELLLRRPARDDDAARRGDDDPGLPALEQRSGTSRSTHPVLPHIGTEHAVPALGAEHVRQRRSTSSCCDSSSWASRATTSRPRAWTATATSRCSVASRCRSRSRR